MNIFTLIFGDRFAQKIGKDLLEYFESERFPQELLQYPEINLLYCEFKLKKSKCKDSINEETIAYLGALLALRRSELEARSKNSDQLPD